MLTVVLVATALKLIGLGAALVIAVRWSHWGATPEERAEHMPGDEYLEGGPPARVAMTRAVSIDATPETLWPWLAQLGRGAGFYSLDRLDNGGRMSARHVVSWIPPPRPGDAAAIGYLRKVVPGSQITWWAPGLRFCGAFARLVVDIRTRPHNAGARLVIRMSADAEGSMAILALWIFRFIDSVMARCQLLRLKERVEAHGARASDPEHPETGARDHFQYYETIYASGESAGVPGREDAAAWRRAAVAADLVDEYIAETKAAS
jgi:hypothetical protein